MKENFPFRKAAAVVLAIGCACVPLKASALVLTYTNEAAYLADVASFGYDTIFEGFEGPDWDGTRVVGQPYVVSQGLVWVGSESVMTGTGWARTGEYGVFDSIGDPDILLGLNIDVGTLFAVGGWVQSSTAESIVLLTDSEEFTFAPLTPYVPHIFLGILDTEGFDLFALATETGQWGADDFTVAYSSAVPEPASATLLGLALAGLIGRHSLKRRA